MTALFNHPVSYFLFSLVFAAYVALGFRNGRAYCAGFSIVRRDDPFGFWIVLLAQIGISIFVFLVAIGLW